MLRFLPLRQEQVGEDHVDGADAQKDRQKRGGDGDGRRR